MIKIVAVSGLILVLCGLAWVRLAPSDPARWHQPITIRSDTDGAVFAVRVADGGPEALAGLARAMEMLARTHVLAGSVAEGRITYITRSQIFGFPDYTTIEQSDGQVRAFARLRFGGSDLGVNRARLEQVFAAAEL